MGAQSALVPQMRRLLLLSLLLVLCFVERSVQLRTGVAPTYIPTMRQRTSYEKSFVNTFNAVIKNIRVRETAQVKAFNRRAQLTADKEALLFVRNAEAALADAERNTNNALLAQKVTEEDGYRKQYETNFGLEPLWVDQQALIAEQQSQLTALTAKHTQLNAHAIKVKTHNDALDVEKRALWETIRQERLVEEREHLQATSQERQRDYEIDDLAQHTTTAADLNSYKTLLNAHNVKYDGLIPALQTSVDNSVALAKTQDINIARLSLESDAEEKHTAELTVTKSALEAYIAKYTAANAVLTARNAALKTEADSLVAARNTLKENYESTKIARNAAQLQADQYEVELLDMQQKLKRVKLENDAADATLESNGRTLHCFPQRDALKTANTALRATNQQLRDECF